MKIIIERNGKNIVVGKDYSDIEDKGEISHMLVELEIIKQDLIELWQEICDEEDLK